MALADFHCDSRIGQKVHYVARGSADGFYPPVCRLAFITGLHDEPVPHDDYGAMRLAYDLCVLNPEGMFFNKDVELDPNGRPGTFHFPWRMS